MFTSGQSVHYWASPAVPAVLCLVVWEGLRDSRGVQTLLVQDATTGRRFVASETRLSQVPLAIADLVPSRLMKAGICPGCLLQPCQCANRKNPNWVQELEAEINRMAVLLENLPRGEK